MNKAIWGLLLLFPFLLSGCIVYSLQPLFTDGDTTFEPGLLGTWLDADGQGYVLERVGGPPAYRITAVNTRVQKNYPPLEGRLVRLDKHLFLDIYTPSGVKCEESMIAVPAHLILKVELSGNVLTLKDLHWAWLSEMLAAKKVIVRHETIRSARKEDPQDPILLTSSTPDLQRNILKFAGNRKAFSLYKALVRKGTAYPAGAPTAIPVPAAVPAATTITAQ